MSNILIKSKRKSADLTRNRILASASKLFTKFGFSATSTNKIAEIANVNEALIFHHFGNKEKLWQAVKQYMTEGLAIQKLNPKPKSVNIFIQDLIKQRLIIYKSNPDILRLIAWQQLEQNKKYLLNGTIYSPENWIAPIQYLQQQGKINPALEPKLIIIWLAASINMIFSDELEIFKDKELKNRYVELLTSGFETILCKKP